MDDNSTYDMRAGDWSCLSAGGLVSASMHILQWRTGLNMFHAGISYERKKKRQGECQLMQHGNTATHLFARRATEAHALHTSESNNKKKNKKKRKKERRR